MVGVVVEGDEMVFGCDRQSRKARTLRLDPSVVLSIEDDFATILPLAARYMHDAPRVLYDYQNKRYGFSDAPDSVRDQVPILIKTAKLLYT